MLSASYHTRGRFATTARRAIIGCYSGSGSSNSRSYSNSTSTRNYNEPISGNVMPRPGGIASMMRLPVQGDATDLDACFVGIPLDSGASNRSGTRFGPRQIRVESVLIRKTCMGTGVDPYSYLRVADVGDISLNMFNLKKACDNIRDGISSIIASGCRPLTMGGDHTLTYPVLQAMKAKYGAVGLIHVDAHSDTSDSMYGEKITHSTPFRRAVEEGCLDCNRVIQIGLRGSGYSTSDYDWARNQGFRIVTGEECWTKSMVELMGEVRGMMGDAPVYLSFDIDALDPAYAPGTGTPEIAGLTPSQALQIIRGSQGLEIVGADLVEVSPPYDMAGTTALTAANLLFEMLCILPRPKRS